MRIPSIEMLFATCCLMVFSTCNTSEDPVAGEVDGGTATLSTAFEEFDKTNMQVYLDGNNVVIETNGKPNHTTPYWGEGNALYTAPETGWQATPSLITGYNKSVKLTVPANPSKANSSTATSLGAIGLAISGSAIYNDQEGNGPLSGAAVSLDYTGAHIGPQDYHYHTEPHAWSKDDDKLIGIMADGFFLYGRKCTSTSAYPTDIDASGGHTSVTKHSTTALYHYHIKNELYINKYYLLFAGSYQGTPNSIR